MEAERRSNIGKAVYLSYLRVFVVKKIGFGDEMAFLSARMLVRNGYLWKQTPVVQVLRVSYFIEGEERKKEKT